MELLKTRGAIGVVHVPYKGLAPALTDARPHFATGVTKAALDASCLADALAAEDDIETALGRYAQERAPAGRRLVARGRYLGAFLEGHGTDPARTPETIVREYGAAGVIDAGGV